MAQEPAACPSYGPNNEKLDLEVDMTGSLNLPIGICGITIMGLVDAGSTISIVHPLVLSRLPQGVNIEMTDRPGRIPLADRSMTDILGTVQLQLQLGIGKVVLVHDMVVADIEAPIVIGVDFLRAHQCVLDIRKYRLMIGANVHTCRAMESMPQIFRICTADTVVIPPLSEMIIPGGICESPHITQGLVEGSTLPLCDGNVMVAHAVLNPAQGTLPVRVMNFRVLNHRK